MKTSSSSRPAETDTSRRAVLAAQARSGLSVPGFAAAHGLSPATLYAWRRRLELTRPRGHRRLQGPAMRAILESLGLPADPPVVAFARGPPDLSWDGPAE
jgi:transposase-like protein